MGRHGVPGTGKPTPDRGFWVRLGAVVVSAALVGTYALTRGEDGTTTATPRPGSSTPNAGAAAGASPPAPTPSASAPATPTATGRPATLSFRVLRESFITVRVPGGRTLVSKVFRKGAQRSFRQKALTVVNGRPSAVRFTVNGRPRKPGPADKPETFTVRRR